MVRSMTAFTRQEMSESWGNLALELRTVNHRYLDLSLRMPEEFRSLEPAIREQVANRLSRGKMDINLRFQRNELGQGELVIDEQLVEQIAKASRKIDHLLYNAAAISSLDVMRWPGVIKTPELDNEQLGEALLNLVNQALDDLIKVREREGAKLAELILQRCKNMRDIVASVKQQLPEIMQSWRDKLVTRLQEAKVEVDANRLEQELVMLAQKTDVDEELDRLVTHLDEIERVLKSDKPIGRRLDFLMQELNREANTLGSKSVHADTTKASVDLKVLIEQMREQIQNIE